MKGFCILCAVCGPVWVGKCPSTDDIRAAAFTHHHVLASAEGRLPRLLARVHSARCHAQEQPGEGTSHGCGETVQAKQRSNEATISTSPPPSHVAASPLCPPSPLGGGAAARALASPRPLPWRDPPTPYPGRCCAPPRRQRQPLPPPRDGHAHPNLAPAWGALAGNHGSVRAVASERVESCTPALSAAAHAAPQCLTTSSSQRPLRGRRPRTRPSCGTGRCGVTFRPPPALWPWPTPGARGTRAARAACIAATSCADAGLYFPPHRPQNRQRGRHVQRSPCRRLRALCAVRRAKEASIRALMHWSPRLAPACGDRSRGDADFRVDALAQLRVLVVHSGGDSQRSPTQSVCGKAWSGLPTAGERLVAPVDHLIEQLAAVARDAPPGVLVACSDVLLTLPEPHAFAGAWSQPGVTGLAIRADAAYGPRHGVYAPGHSRARARPLSPPQRRPCTWAACLARTDTQPRVQRDLCGRTSRRRPWQTYAPRPQSPATGKSSSTPGSSSSTGPPPWPSHGPTPAPRCAPALGWVCPQATQPCAPSSSAMCCSLPKGGWAAAEAPTSPTAASLTGLHSVLRARRCGRPSTRRRCTWRRPAVPSLPTWGPQRSCGTSWCVLVPDPTLPTVPTPCPCLLPPRPWPRRWVGRLLGAATCPGPTAPAELIPSPHQVEPETHSLSHSLTPRAAALCGGDGVGATAAVVRRPPPHAPPCEYTPPHCPFPPTLRS